MGILATFCIPWLMLLTLAVRVPDLKPSKVAGVRLATLNCLHTSTRTSARGRVGIILTRQT